MALSENKVSVQNFTGGLITDYHELNTPQNITVDEQNCDLDRKGFRKRRLGMTYEEGFEMNPQDIYSDVLGTLYIKSYPWNDINNDADLNFLVVQMGPILSFYDAAYDPLSAGLKNFTVDLNVFLAPGQTTAGADGISVASGKGYLFVCGRAIEPFYITYNTDDTITSTQINIQIRDMMQQDNSLPNDQQGPYNAGPSGQDIIITILKDIEDLLSPPSTSAKTSFKGPPITPGRLYDLMNQGWGYIPSQVFDFAHHAAILNNTTTSALQWYVQQEGRYPPKTKPWWVGKRLGDQGLQYFVPDDTYDIVDGGNTLAALGHYILNAFSQDRSGVSGVAGIPIVTITDRPTAIAFYAGRVFYALGNTIYFSQVLTDDIGVVGKCYMESDPTSEQINNLVATDGGTILIPQSSTPLAFFAIEASLILFSSNGTWIISGSSIGEGFSAEGFSVNRISDVACVSSRSIINVEGYPMWWAPNGIYTMSPSSVKQSFQVQTISLKKIQNLFDGIVPLAKQFATGCYDHIRKRVTWLYQNAEQVNDSSDQFFFNNVLNYDLIFDAWSTYTIQDLNVPFPSKVVDIFNIQPITLASSTEDVVDQFGKVVTASDTSNVYVTRRQFNSAVTILSDVKYLTTGPVDILLPHQQGPFCPNLGQTNVPPTTSPFIAPYNVEGWDTPEHIECNDPDVAKISTQLTFDTYSVPGFAFPYLRGSIYNFSIPPTATITGVEIGIVVDGNDEDYTFQSGSIKLAWGVNASITSIQDKGGFVTGRPVFVNGVEVQNSGDNVLRNYTLIKGGPNDLWGSTLTPTIINSPDFGVIFRPARAQYNIDEDARSRGFNVDTMNITVYYTV